jgi:hypothetical protein
MAHLDFLAADVPLVKTFTLRGDVIESSPYPMVRDFTSHRAEVSSLEEVHTALLTAADAGHCLLKGTLARPITNESRAGQTNPADATQLLCLDLDGLQGPKNIDAALQALHLHEYAHIIQWSASSHVFSGRGLSCHVFFWLTAPVNPQLMKSWIMNACMAHFANAVELTKTGAALHWPVDPSVMDNSKLIYIAPPVLHGLKSKIKGNPITLVTAGLKPALPSSHFTVNPQEVQRAKSELLNELRKKSGLSAIRDSQFKTSGGQLFLSKPGNAIVTGMKVERGFIYLNLNGGDSWGYYHPEDNPEYVYNFKGEPIYKTEELLPEYWAHLKGANLERPKGGVTYFVCRDFRTDRLYNGIYDAEGDRLDFARAANEGRLRGFMKQHGQPVPEFIPDFKIEYNPQDTKKFDLDARRINTYMPGPFYGLERREVKAIPPTILQVITSVFGAANVDHWVNHFACVLQHRVKIGTAWVAQGIEGTGKGVLFHNVIKPILGAHNVVNITSRELDSPFNGYLEQALYVFVDEIQISALRGSMGIAATLRNFITDSPIAIRRMFTEPFNAPNYCNFMFASNQPDPVVVPESDRRFHVGHFQNQKLTFGELEIQALAREVEDFFHYLMAYKADLARARTILQSEDRDRLIKMSMTAGDEMAAVLREGNLEDLVENLPQRAVLPAEMAYTALISEILRAGEDKTALSRDDLFTLFNYRVGEVPASPNKFTTYLRHRKIDIYPMKKDKRAMRGTHVIWKQSKEWMAQALMTLSSAANDAGPKVVPMRAKI